MRRAIGTVLVLAGVGMAGPGSGEGYLSGPTDLAPVDLTIRNDTGSPLRCTVVLAHFVTRALEPIPPSGELALALERHAASGTLAFGWHDGAPMLVENILCGSDGDWDATRTDLPLTPIRAGTGDAFACTIAAGADCGMQP